MKVLAQPFSLSQILSFVWTGIRIFIYDIFRYWYREEVEVKTKSGRVKGYRISSSFNYRYYNFIGIPYAKSPVGELRFKDPQPLEPSNEVINAKFGLRGSMAWQADLLTNIKMGTEDCLHLSIFTHDLKPSIPKPVMVWIHGGAFAFGSNAKEFFNPEFLLREDIVLISINYRLGALGFLSLKDPSLGIPGNAGLKDQVMALKWIKENCMHFGGDSNNITVFGESAGAVSVSMHMLSNQSKDLFNKAILMSGSPYAPWAISSDEQWSHKLARKLGWNGKNGESGCLAVLKEASPKAIVRMQEEITTLEDRKQLKIFPFSPIIEPYESEQCFLNKYPIDLIKDAWSKHVPMLAGMCSNEGLIFYKTIKKEPEILQAKNLKCAPLFTELNLYINSEECLKMTKRMNSFYFDQSKNEISTFFMFLHDSAFAYPLYRLIALREKYGYAPTYSLHFNFESTYSLAKRLFVGENIPGVCHGDDCSYYFRTVALDPAEHTDEWRTMDRMCKIFTSFARFGNPNNESIASIQWKPMKLNGVDPNEYNYKCLNISNKVSYSDWDGINRMQLWDEIFEHLSYNGQKM